MDVQEVAAVTFDSYAKDGENTAWESEYGPIHDKDKIDDKG